MKAGSAVRSMFKVLVFTPPGTVTLDPIPRLGVVLTYWLSASKDPNTVCSLVLFYKGLLAASVASNMVVLSAKVPWLVCNVVYPADLVTSYVE